MREKDLEKERFKKVYRNLATLVEKDGHFPDFVTEGKDRKDRFFKYQQGRIFIKAEDGKFYTIFLSQYLNKDGTEQAESELTAIVQPELKNHSWGVANSEDAGAEFKLYSDGVAATTLSFEDFKKFKSLILPIKEVKEVSYAHDYMPRTGFYMLDGGYLGRPDIRDEKEWKSAPAGERDYVRLIHSAEEVEKLAELLGKGQIFSPAQTER